MSKFRETTELSYAVRFSVVLKYLGQLCLISSVLTCVPGLFALACGEFSLSPAYFVAAAMLAAFGAGTGRLKAPRHIQRNEAYVIAALVFPLSALVTAGLFTNTGLAFEDALFESVSGVTTTGLSTLPTVEDKPRTFLFARAWQQWYGGLGVVVLSLAIAAHPGALRRRLGLAEASEDDLLGSTRAHARRVLLVYSGITLVGFAGLWALGLSWFDAVAHSFAAVSTGGFSTRDNSLAEFPSIWPQIAATGVCFVCAVSLPFYWRAGREGWRVLFRDWQWLALLSLATVAVVSMAGFMMHAGNSLTSAARHASLMAFSAQSTAGFSSTPVAELDPASKLVLIFSMAVGGGTASTAGGFKVLRLLIVFRLLTALLVRTAITKHAVHEPHLGRHRLEDRDIEAALLIVVLFVLVVLLSWLPFVAMGFDPLDSLFEVVSATGTVGLSTGISSESMPGFLKAVLCLDMLLGRLEFIALLVVVFPRTWFGKRVESS